MLKGGGGDDQFRFIGTGFGADIVADYQTGDSIRLTGYATSALSFAWNVDNPARPFLRLNAGGNRIDLKGLGSSTVFDIRGNDDSLLSIPMLILGTSGDDAALSGTTGADAIYGLAGNDRISGLGGADRFVFAGTSFGADEITDFGNGADSLVLTGYAASAISLSWVEGASLTGSIFRIPIKVNAGSNSIILYRSGAKATLEAAGQQLAVTDSSGISSGKSLARLVLGSNTADTLIAAATGSYLYGLDGDDSLTGTSGAEWFYGGGGDDTLTGNAGADRFVFAGTSFGHDVVTDYTIGSDGLVFTAYTASAVSASWVAVRQENTSWVGVVRLEAGNNSVMLEISKTTKAQLAAVTSLTFSRPATTKTLPGLKIGSDQVSGIETVTGTASADALFGLGGADQLQGKAGADILDGGAGNDTLSGGAGADVFIFRGSGFGRDTISDFAYGEEIIITGYRAADIFIGWHGATLEGTVYTLELVRAGGNSVSLSGARTGLELLSTFGAGLKIYDSSDTRITFTTSLKLGTGNMDTLTAESFGSTALFGFAGADVLTGRGNADVLDGGAGADTLTGGAGADKFVLETANKAKDAVTDFTSGDRIRVDVTDTQLTTINAASGAAAKLTALKTALNIDWTNTSNETTGASNDASTNDTVIYDLGADNTLGGSGSNADTISMVLEDTTTALVIGDFEII